MSLSRMWSRSTKNVVPTHPTMMATTREHHKTLKRHKTCSYINIQNVYIECTVLRAQYQQFTDPQMFTQQPHRQTNGNTCTQYFTDPQIFIYTTNSFLDKWNYSLFYRFTNIPSYNDLLAN
jgi:hypothetical protein